MTPVVVSIISMLNFVLMMALLGMKSEGQGKRLAVAIACSAIIGGLLLALVIHTWGWVF